MPDYIARFEVLEKIGEGGMGAVFKARDPHISRIVAIKLLRDGFDSKELRERFMQEARSAGSLQSPNIVSIFELGEHGGAPFIVMEFVVGETLDRLIKRRAALSLVRKLSLMEALCTGLGYAHRAGVIHRDIKPANLIVSSDGDLKILDFGIAHVGSSELTKTGEMMGSPNYMPPEQLNGEPVDKRADIFAVGAVFYELLTYQRAFPGNFTEAITRILSREPDPPSSLSEGLDGEIDGIVLKALSKDRNRRYQDLGEMRREVLKIRERIERDSPETGAATLYGDYSATMVVGPTAVGEHPGKDTVKRIALDLARAEVEAAKQQFDRGETAEAIRRLESFEPPHPVVSDALASLRDRADELARQSQRVATIVKSMDAASGAFERQDYVEAIRSADEVLLIDEGHGPAREVKRRARATIDEQRRVAELERRAGQTIDEARRAFAHGERQEAIERLVAFQPAHTAVATALAELQLEADRLRAEEEAAATRESDRQRAEALAREEAARREQEELVARQAESARRAKEEAERQAEAAALAEESARQAKAAALAEEQRLAAAKAAEALEREQQELARQQESARREESRRAQEQQEQEARRQAAALAEQQAREEAATLVTPRAAPQPAAPATVEPRTAPQPAEPPAAEPRSSSGTRLGAIAAGVALVAALGYGVFRMWSPAAPATEVTATVAQPAAAPVSSGQTNVPPAAPTPAAASATFPVTIDAVPWANVEITPVNAASGVQPQTGVTPLVATLPAGDYTVRLTNSLASREVVETLKVSPGGQNAVRRDMPGMDADRIVQEILPK